MQLDVKIENVTPISRKLTIKVPSSRVADALQKGLLKVQKTAKIKGFRPGHVPLTVVKQYYGTDIKHQVFHDVIDESFREVVRENKLRTVGAPKIDTPDHQTGAGAHDHSIEEGRDLTYVATVEILPEIEVKGYTGLSLSQTKVEVTSKEVDAELEKVRNSQAQLQPAKEGIKAVIGDFVDLEFKGGIKTEHGIEEREGMSGRRMIELGTNTLIEGFEAKLVGMKQGETKTFEITFPKDYFETSLAGMVAEFTCTIHEIKTKILPELNDELAKTLNFESLATLKTRIEESLKQQLTQDSERKLKSDLMQALIEKTKFEVPAALIETQTRNLAQDVAQNLKQQGFTNTMVQEALGAELPELRKRAEAQVRASLILEAISQKEKIEVSSQEVDKEISLSAKSMNVPEERVREFYRQNPGRRADLEFRMREDRTVQFLLKSAKIKTV
jgi:trigger factor